MTPGSSTSAASRPSTPTASQWVQALQSPASDGSPTPTPSFSPSTNSVLAEANPDRKLFFPLEDRIRSLDLTAANLKTIPATLTEYLAKVVIPTLERQKVTGAVAEKLEIAYLRPFGFTKAPRAEAERIYARYANKPRPDSVQYKLLQDFLFRYIA